MIKPYKKTVIPEHHNDNGSLNETMLTSEIMGTINRSKHHADIMHDGHCMSIHADYENGVIRVFYAPHENEDEIHVVLEYIQYDNANTVINGNGYKQSSVISPHIPCDYTCYKVIRMEYYINDSNEDIYDCISELTLILSCLNVYDEALPLMNGIENGVISMNENNGTVSFIDKNGMSVLDMSRTDYKALKFMYDSYDGRIRTDYKPIRVNEL